MTLKFTKTVCAIVILTFSFPVFPSPVQWSGNGHWYEAVLIGDDGIAWDDANAGAISRGGYLTTITSAAENLFVFGLIDSDPFWDYQVQHGRGPWIGGTDANSEGNWEWVTGEAFSYSNWAPGEPNNHSPGEDYLHYFANNGLRNSTWNDLSNGGSWPELVIRSYVVEYNSEPVPGPSSLLLLIVGTVFLRRLTPS